MKHWPRLSVIVPVYNGAEFVGATLASVCAQGYSPSEIIVVDDGSTDNLAQVVASFQESHWPGLQYVYQANSGPAAARNRGLELVRGELIAFLDADDLWVAGAIPALTDQLTTDDVQLVVGCMQSVQTANDGGAGRLLPIGQVWFSFSLSATIFRRQCFDQVGEFDPTLRFGEDVDWFLRAREAGLAIGVHDTVVAWRRRHDRNMTRDTEQSNHYFLVALRKSLQRRRCNCDSAPELPPVPPLEGRAVADFQNSRFTPGMAPGPRRSGCHG